MLSTKQYSFIKNLIAYALPLVVVCLWLVYLKSWDPTIFYLQGALICIIWVCNVLLRIDSKLYLGDGVMFVDDSDPDKLICRIELDSNLSDVASKESLTFIVKKAFLD